MIRALIPLTGAAFLAFAAVSETPTSTDAVYGCAELDNDKQRLACYDTAVGRLKAAEEAGEVTTITRAEVEQVQKDSFGFSIPSLPKLAMPRFGGDNENAQLKQIKQVITGASLNSYKKAVITLENGQVWQQTDSTNVYISKKRPPKTAIVKSASMGSFMVKLDSGRAFRARRIK